MLPKGKLSVKSTKLSFGSDTMTSFIVSFIIILSCVTNKVDGTIKVISISENETVYTIQERSLGIRASGEGLEGILVKAKPLDACGAVSKPPDFNESYVNWILFATWQGIDDLCPLVNKIKNADAAGYSAIIIQTTPGNDSDFIPMAGVSDWYGIGMGIYPCLVSYEEGITLRTNYTGEDYVLRFEDEQINTWLGFFIASVLVILAILLAIGLSYVIVQMFVLILLWIRETIINAVQQRRRDRRRRLPASQLKKIPTQQWTPDIPQDTCTICLENFVVDDRVRILPCSHVFHMVCIDPWLLNQRRKCPNCKGKIVLPDERYDSDTSTEDERTPLLRRGSSPDRDQTQIFTFNDDDASHPVYTTIHRIFDEAGNLPRPQAEAGPSPSTSAASISGNRQDPPVPQNPYEALPGETFNNFVQRLTSPTRFSNGDTGNGNIQPQPILHTTGTPPNSSRLSNQESHSHRSLQGMDNEGLNLSVNAINVADDDEVVVERGDNDWTSTEVQVTKAHSSSNNTPNNTDINNGNQGINFRDDSVDNATGACEPRVINM